MPGCVNPLVVKLLVIGQNASVQEVTLRRPRTVVGRKKGCKLRIRSELVSRIHCSLICDGKHFRAKDLGSSNGTFVNGIRITEAQLRPGDVVQIGPVKFVVQIVGQEVAPMRAPHPVPAASPGDDEVVFIEADETIDDGDEIIDADLLDEVADGSGAVTRDGRHPPIPPQDNIFVADGDSARDVAQFLLPDEKPEDGYRVANPPENDGPTSRRKP